MKIATAALATLMTLAVLAPMPAAATSITLPSLLPRLDFPKPVTPPTRDATRPREG